MDPVSLPENADQALIVLVGVLVLAVTGVLWFVVKAWSQARLGAEQASAVNRAVNHVDSESPTISENVQHLVREVDRLVRIQDEFSSKGWSALPPDLTDAPALTHTIRELQRLAEQAAIERAEIKAKLFEHDRWEKDQKYHT